MKIVEYTHFGSDPRLKDIWQNLIAFSDADSIFSGYHWAHEWWRVFKQKDDRLRLMLVLEDGEVRGIAPLYATKELWGGFQADVLALVGQTTAEYLGMILSVKPTKAIFDLLDFLSRRPKWDVLSLNRMPMHSSNVKQIKKIAIARKLTIVEELEEICPYIYLTGDYKTFMLERFRSKFRKEIKRNTRHLKAKGDHRFEMVCDAKRLHRVFNEIVKLEKHSWKGKEKLGLFSTRSQRTFYYQMMQNLAERGELALLLQWLDNKLISYDIGFLSNNRFLAFSTAFDSNFRRYAPGVLSQAELIRQCYKMNISIFDFLRGGEHYKAKWTDTATQNINLYIFAPTNKGRFLAGIIKNRMLLRKIKRRIWPRQDVADFRIVNNIYIENS